MASRLKAYSDLFRFENALTGLIGVLIGAIVVDGASFEFSDVIVVSSFGISVMFFMFCWNAYNDITDIENDAMNRPDRPLPSGRLSVNSARKGMYFSLLVSITSLSFGLLELRREGNITAVHYSGGIWLLAILLLISYEGFSGLSGLKHKGLLGNLCIALAIGMDVIFGASGMGSPTDAKVISLALMAVSFSFARELIKDIEDMDGDYDRATYPRNVGSEKARSLAWFLTLTAFVILFIPFLSGIFPQVHALLVAPGGVLLMMVKTKLYISDDRSAQYLIKRSLQVSMAGVIASVFLLT